MVILSKIIKVLIIMMYAVVYTYSTWMTTMEPEKTIWGWICTFIFGIGSIWLITNFKDNKNARKEEGNSSEEGILH
jgi:hypothetical protein